MTDLELYKKTKKYIGKEVTIEGIKNTAPLHAKIMANEYFHEGNICTDFLPKYVFNK